MKKYVFRNFCFVLFLFVTIPVFGQDIAKSDQINSLKMFKSVLEKNSQIEPKKFKTCEIEYKYYPSNGRFPVSNMSNYPGNDRVTIDRSVSNIERQNIYNYHNFNNSKLFGLPIEQELFKLNLAKLDSNQTEILKLDNKKYVVLYLSKEKMYSFQYKMNYFLLDVKSRGKAEQVQNALIQAIKACEQ